MPRQDRDHILTTNPLYEIVMNILEKKGRDLTKCEQCGVKFGDVKPNLHHTKYENATIDDLEVVCQKCNLKTENKGLK